MKPAYKITIRQLKEQLLVSRAKIARYNLGGKSWVRFSDIRANNNAQQSIKVEYNPEKNLSEVIILSEEDWAKMTRNNDMEVPMLLSHIVNNKKVTV